MDTWKYHGIMHRNHLVCNPTSDDKLNEFVSLLPLDQGPRILDIACGKGEQLLRVARHFDGTGVGVDISPYEVREARRRLEANNLQHRVEIIESDGADYAAEPGSFDLAMCIGATWVYGGYRGTIDALRKVLKPGGLLAIGEPFKLKEPSAEYAALEPDFASNLVWHYQNVEIARDAGIVPLYNIVSNQDDWDRYEGLNLLAAETYVLENPDDPDNDELLRRQRRASEVYLKWGRGTVNWAIYLFRLP